ATVSFRLSLRQFHNRGLLTSKLSALETSFKRVGLEISINVLCLSRPVGRLDHRAECSGDAPSTRRSVLSRYQHRAVKTGWNDLLLRCRINLFYSVELNLANLPFPLSGSPKELYWSKYPPRAHAN